MVARRHKLKALMLVFCLSLAGCGGLPVSGGAGDDGAATSREEPADTGVRPVSASLLTQSRALQRDGNYAAAAATLERAIRIDPVEPAVWLELARVRYAEDNWPQAEQLARKAKSLAGPGSAQAAAADRMIVDALRMQGRAGGPQRPRR